ncbi:MULTISPECIES: AAA family ATPase [unclassified Arthrobacter]|uniref:AAA family ATPase n=1 Tax=unclassified Arthrobacter TaxID=235627 RepID=UPI001D15A18A|nr:MULTISPECIES: AAA family ATPase [unclassified Arthrobacter]MCC3274987.1 AAA family ATPase [Arthrobacter sp. zg-Y20]MCC3279041.1 AAA family ATPase [Arthrobacter sp. zg-Y40]MCC9177416.1 AAA family ATPase [Arthrobacter sp. zg-Y750]MDK1315144.1 AAA family ATPase [Arthrobacter sp. zg.Y20]WIB04986.1 AAA family ATPase [Arthrobacter sp. zg-Y20]
MNRFGQGVVIGKFYPPHAGHRHLIAAAAGQCTGLAVVVLASRFESISMENRVKWLAAEFEGSNVTVIGMPDDCPVDYGSRAIWKAHNEVLRLALKMKGITAVDAVFSSEDYGRQLAGDFGAAHVMVDRERMDHPVSGTLCRDDLRAAWADVIGPARQDLAVRIIVVGAESTGTTTLAAALTGHYRKSYPDLADVPEYGRQFTYDKFAAAQAADPDAVLTDMVWTAADFAHIGERQNQMENDAADRCPLVIADTDVITTALFERVYIGEQSYGSYLAVERIPRRDLYLITDHEGVPFEDDGWREAEHPRAEMTEWFKEELTAAGASWILVSGTREERLATATEIIDLIIARRNHFTSPPWATRTVLAGR